MADWRDGGGTFLFQNCSLEQRARRDGVVAAAFLQGMRLRYHSLLA